jgi:hypothetical protein
MQTFPVFFVDFFNLAENCLKKRYFILEKKYYLCAENNYY